MKTSLSILCFLVAVGAQAASAATVPYDLQGVLIARVLKYDDQFIPKTRDRVVVVYRPGGDPGCKQIMTALAAAGVTISSSVPYNLTPPKDTVALYVCPDVSPDLVSPVAENLSLLTVTGSASPVIAGALTLGLEAIEDHPRLVVNVTRMKKEGHVLASELLGLARIVR